MSFPYSIPADRELTKEERSVLLRLLADVDSSRSNEVDALHVLARCGCGKCPTIMFETEPQKKKEPKFQIADHIGATRDGQKIGIHLWEREGRLVELEAWSAEGGDVTAWPELSTIQSL